MGEKPLDARLRISRDTCKTRDWRRTEELNEVSALPKAVRKYARRTGFVRVWAADFDWDCGAAGTRFYGVRGGELDEVCDADLLFVCEVAEVAAYALEAPVLDVVALFGEDQGAIAGSVETVVERTTDGCTSCVWI